MPRLAQKDTAASSGAYSYGLARVMKYIARKFNRLIPVVFDADLGIAGEYTLVLSSFEPQHMGPFTLKVESSHSFNINPIPQEGAGMYSRIIRGSWYSLDVNNELMKLKFLHRDGQSAAGAPSFNKYTQNPVYKLEVPSVTQLKCVRLLRF